MLYFIKDDEFMLTDKGEFEYLELEEKEKLALCRLLHLHRCNQNVAYLLAQLLLK